MGLRRYREDYRLLRGPFHNNILGLSHTAYQLRVLFHKHGPKIIEILYDISWQTAMSAINTCAFAVLISVLGVTLHHILQPYLTPHKYPNHLKFTHPRALCFVRCALLFILLRKFDRYSKH